jgi:hypothetical protein
MGRSHNLFFLHGLGRKAHFENSKCGGALETRPSTSLFYIFVSLNVLKSKTFNCFTLHCINWQNQLLEKIALAKENWNIF